MKSFLVLLTLITSTASAEGVDTVSRCFQQTARPSAPRLEFKRFDDTDTGWSGGFVRYGNSTNTIPLVSLRDEVLESPPGGRPWLIRSVWLEVTNGKPSGEYSITSQGAVITAFSYRSYATNKATMFKETPCVVL